MYKLLYANSLLPSPVKLSLILVIIANTALYISLPILPTYIVEDKQMDGAIVGIVLSLTLFTSSVFSIFTGFLSDKFGYKIMIVGGLILRSIGFFGTSIIDNVQGVVILSFINGLGSAFNRPAISSVLASASPEMRPIVFALYNQMLNIGVVIGPIIGALGLLFIDPKYCFIISGSLFIVGAAIAQILLFTPSTKPSSEIRLVDNVKVVLADKKFIIYCFAVFFGWFLISQLNITWSIKAVEKGGALIWANIFVFFNGLIGIIAMHIICKIFIGLKVLRLVFLGFVGMIITLIIVTIANKTLIWLLLCLILYTIAESFLLQGLELKVVEHITPNSSASYYGIFNFVAGMGGIIGSYCGGCMISCMNDSTIWFLLAIIGSCGLIPIYFLAYMEESSRKYN